MYNRKNVDGHVSYNFQVYLLFCVATCTFHVVVVATLLGAAQIANWMICESLRQANMHA